MSLTILLGLIWMYKGWIIGLLACFFLLRGTTPIFWK
jgi:hypothetical protein